MPPLKMEEKRLEAALNAQIGNRMEICEIFSKTITCLPLGYVDFR